MLGTTTRNAALWTGTGAALAWLALTLLGDKGASYDETPDRVAPPTVAERRSGAPPSPEAAPVAAAEARPDVAVEAADLADWPVPVRSSNPIVSDAPPSNSPVTRTDLPNRRDGDLSTASAAAGLLDSARISCDFGAGNNTGTRVGDLLTVSGGAQWQGGLILYDFMDAEAGTARMTGGVGATGSPDGETKIQVTTEGTRVFLSSFLENGAFVMVTIFDELDNVGRHIAVMSRHEGSFSYASQFLGICE